MIILINHPSLPSIITDILSHNQCLASVSGGISWQGLRGYLLKSCVFCTFAILKKAISILFLSLFLFSTTEAHQLLKLPVVFQHFQEHQRENKSITLLEFLDMHYMHGSPNDEDHDRDMQLPFKSSDDCITAFGAIFIPLSLQIFVSRPEICSVPKIFGWEDQCLHAAYLSSIWQPPKYC